MICELPELGAVLGIDEHDVDLGDVGGLLVALADGDQRVRRRRGGGARRSAMRSAMSARRGEARPLGRAHVDLELRLIVEREEARRASVLAIGTHEPSDADARDDDDPAARASPSASAGMYARSMGR